MNFGSAILTLGVFLCILLFITGTDSFRRGFTRKAPYMRPRWQQRSLDAPQSGAVEEETRRPETTRPKVSPIEDRRWWYKQLKKKDPFGCPLSWVGINSNLKEVHHIILQWTFSRHVIHTFSQSDERPRGPCVSESVKTRQCQHHRQHGYWYRATTSSSALSRDVAVACHNGN